MNLSCLTTEEGNLFSFDLNQAKIFVLDFTKNNEELHQINFNDVEEFNRYVKNVLIKNGATIEVGRYNEDRIIYKSSLYHNRRSVHLGIDIALPKGTKVLAPLDAIIHSLHDNKGKGDYGPTIILEHEVRKVRFYTLYGHLSRNSLEGKIIGQKITRGNTIGEIGNTKENGNWFEHLHFQIITDMMGKSGDFPGVVTLKNREMYIAVCSNPNLILRILKI